MSHDIGHGLWQVSPMLVRALSVLLVGLIAAFMVACDGNGSCACFVCDRAVTLTVVDATDTAPIDDFVVEAILNDVPIGEPAECREVNREGPTCRFGDTPGYYLLIVRSPGYETAEAAVRLPAQEAVECCFGGACLNARELTVALTPLQ